MVLEAIEQVCRIVSGDIYGPDPLDRRTFCFKPVESTIIQKIKESQQPNYEAVQRSNNPQVKKEYLDLVVERMTASISGLKLKNIEIRYYEDTNKVVESIKDYLIKDNPNRVGILPDPKKLDKENFIIWYDFDYYGLGKKQVIYAVSSAFEHNKQGLEIRLCPYLSTAIDISKGINIMGEDVKLKEFDEKVASDFLWLRAGYNTLNYILENKFHSQKNLRVINEINLPFIKLLFKFASRRYSKYEVAIIDKQVRAFDKKILKKFGITLFPKDVPKPKRKHPRPSNKPLIT